MHSQLRCFSIAAADVGAIAAKGPRDPVFGSLIDLGTSAYMPAAEISQLTDRVLRIGQERGARFSVENMQWREIENPLARRFMLEHAAESGRLLVMVWQESANAAVLLITSGADLPNMGFAGVCDADRFERTARFLMGDVEAAIGSIFAEPEGHASPEEQSLMVRLRALYGD